MGYATSENSKSRAKTQHIKSINLNNFRNYDALEINNLGRINILMGPNAVGKTNAIEAIQLLTELSSFRHPQISDIIPIKYKDNQTNSKPSLCLTATFEDDNVVKLVLSDNKKQYLFNGKRKTIVDIKGRYPAVVFTPDDLMLVKGNNSLRLKTLDSLGSQLSKNYYTVRKDYSKVLEQKRQLLKDGADINTLRAINDVMVLPAAQLICYRSALVNKIQPLLHKCYKNICSDSSCNEVLLLKYTSVCEDNNYDRDEIIKQIKSELQNLEKAEILAKHVLFGPHKDKIDFLLNDALASKFASQGQQRSIVLALKLAENKLIEKLLNKHAVLLLDDVMSELDANRRRALISYFPADTQVFITTTNLNYFDNDLLQTSNIIELS